MPSIYNYNDEYSFYDMESDKEDLVEFLEPEKREHSNFVVINDDKL